MGSLFSRDIFLSLFLIGILSVPAFAEDPVQDPDQLVFVFQKQTNPDQIKAAGDKVASYLTAELGMPVKVQVPSDYSASIQALISKKADFAYTSSLPFLLARRDGHAEILLAEQRIDPRGVARTEYDSIFVVRKDSKLTSYEDLAKHAKETRIVFTSPTSTSGYVFPLARFVKEGVVSKTDDLNQSFKSASFGGGYTQALEEVAGGRADVAVVSYYTMEGNSADNYFPSEKREKLRILARTPGVPTHVISARSGLSNSLKARVKTALLKLAKEHPELLTDVYGTASFVEVDENIHVQQTVDAVKVSGLPIDGLV